jgi:putative endonuclease
MRDYNFYVYFTTNNTGTLYLGITKNLQVRLSQHRTKLNKNSFTARYNCLRLVYYEHYTDVFVAIAREKQLKRWSRSKKLKLIETTNPTFKDISEDWK